MEQDKKTEPRKRTATSAGKRKTAAQAEAAKDRSETPSTDAAGAGLDATVSASAETGGPIAHQIANGEREPRLFASIRARAYLLFEEGGRQHGHDLDHWLEAERQVMGEWHQEAA